MSLFLKPIPEAENFDWDIQIIAIIFLRKKINLLFYMWIIQDIVGSFAIFFWKDNLQNCFIEK